MAGEIEAVQTMARRYMKALMEQDEDAADAVLVEINERDNSEAVLAVLREARRQADFEWAEQQAAHERELRRFAGIRHIFAGLETMPGMTFSKACEIKAAQGDALARQYVDYFNSREFRLDQALTEAAVAVHSGWRDDGDGHLTKLSDDAPEVTDGSLVEWFQKNYPKEAKRIEREIDAGDDDARAPSAS